MSGNVNLLARLEVQMTHLSDGTIHPGAKKAFDEIYRGWGLGAIAILNDRGFGTPTALDEFFRVTCHNSVAEVARRLSFD